MAAEDFDIGALLTGPQSPLNLEPTSRSALLSFGLQAMQPVGVGQTPLGALAQAIGAAGETVSRQEEMDLKDTVAQNKLATAEQRLELARMRQENQEGNLKVRERLADVAQQNANTRAAKKSGGLTDMFRARMDQTARNAYDRDIAGQAARIAKQANDTLVAPDANSPVAKYRGKSEAQIREMLKQEQPYVGTQYKTGNPTMDDEDEDDDPVVQGGGATVPGARGTPGAPATPPPAAASTTIPAGSIAYLRNNANDPSIRQQFDMYYGSGAAAQILGR